MMRLVCLAALLASACGKPGGSVTDTQNVTDDAGCPSSCAEGQTLCRGVCVDTRFDPRNCGACGTDCGDDVCQGGACIEVCAQGDTLCGDDCVNVRCDVKNCGACGLVCAAGSLCQDDHCVPACSQGKTRCGDDCTDIDDDPNNCGACGTCCGTGHACHRGLCECDRGLTNCEGFCTSLERDVENCGACDHACPWDQVCVEGSCQRACDTGETLCDDETCANLESDPAHCGRCDIACAPGQGCASGSCVSPPSDGGPADAGEADAGLADAGEADAGPADGGGADAGVCPGENFCADTGTCFGDGGCCTSADCTLPPHVSVVSCSMNACEIGNCSAGFVDVDLDAGNGCECADSFNGKSCGAATNLGTLNPGNTLTWSGKLPVANEDNWAEVTFASTEAACQSQTASITFTQNPGDNFRLEVFSNCQDVPRGGTVDNGFAWIFSANCTADGGSIGLPGGPVGTVFVRVHQNSGAQTCEPFTLEFTN